MIKNRRAFIVGLKSSKLSNKEITFLKKYKPWGVILFSRNISSIEQTKKLTDKIKKIFKDKKYPILIDQEGGRVNRLSEIISFDNLTSEYFGNLFTKDKKKFNIIYKLFIDKTSYLLKSIGVNINTVPVLDLRVKGASNIIGDRSFSKNKKNIRCIRIVWDTKIYSIVYTYIDGFEKWRGTEDKKFKVKRTTNTHLVIKKKKQLPQNSDIRHRGIIKNFIFWHRLYRSFGHELNASKTQFD